MTFYDTGFGGPFPSPYTGGMVDPPAKTATDRSLVFMAPVSGESAIDPSRYKKQPALNMAGPVQSGGGLVQRQPQGYGDAQTFTMPGRSMPGGYYPGAPGPRPGSPTIGAGGGYGGVGGGPRSTFPGAPGPPPMMPGGQPGLPSFSFGANGRTAGGIMSFGNAGTQLPQSSNGPPPVVGPAPGQAGIIGAAPPPPPGPGSASSWGTKKKPAPKKSPGDPDGGDGGGGGGGGGGAPGVSMPAGLHALGAPSARGPDIFDPWQRRNYQQQAAGMAARV